MDCVVGAVDAGVDTEGEKVLVVVGIYSYRSVSTDIMLLCLISVIFTFVDLCSPAMRVFIFIHGVCVENTSKSNLGLNSSILLYVV